jgi:methylase of polypeptide subunit release factors
MRLAITVQGVRVRLDIPERKVFVPNLIGVLSATQLLVRRGDRVCDVGTGSGFHAILCAKLGAGSVLGVDPNPEAIRCAKANARLNGVAGACRFLLGDFSRVFARPGPRFDLIVSTLPNTPSGDVGKEAAMRRAPGVARFLGGGEDGSELSCLLAREAPRRLSASGRLHMHMVDWGAAPRVRRALLAAGFLVRPVARAGIPEWGRRCNAQQRYARLHPGRPWLLDFGAFPRKAGSRVVIVEARRRRASIVPVSRRPGTAQIERVLP